MESTRASENVYDRIIDYLKARARAAVCVAASVAVCVAVCVAECDEVCCSCALDSSTVNAGRASARERASTQRSFGYIQICLRLFLCVSACASQGSFVCVFF